MQSRLSNLLWVAALAVIVPLLFAAWIWAAYLIVGVAYAELGGLLGRDNAPAPAVAEPAAESRTATEVGTFIRQPGVGAALAFPTADCSGDEASVTFAWTPVAGSSVQWLDLGSEDNGFAEGTFVSSGPHPPDVRTFTWTGIAPGEPHYWRINSSTLQGWVASKTGAFVACSGPLLLPPAVECKPDGSATVRFRWLPVAGSTSQWLDVSARDGSFVEDTYTAYGPFAGDESSYGLLGFVSGVTYHYRVNSYTGEWQPSATASLTPDCPRGARRP